MEEKDHLPIFGIGPFYIIVTSFVTILCIVLSYVLPLFNKGHIENELVVLTLRIFGFCFITEGIFMILRAVFGRNRIYDYIISNRLCTTGIYAVVRNPIFSGVNHIAGGLILFTHNWFLFPLGFISWIFLTLTVRKTEEKWLTDLHGEEYIKYCHTVNRVIPRLPLD